MKEDYKRPDILQYPRYNNGLWLVNTANTFFSLASHWRPYCVDLGNDKNPLVFIQHPEAQVSLDKYITFFKTFLSVRHNTEQVFVSFHKFLTFLDTLWSFFLLKYHCFWLRNTAFDIWFDNNILQVKSLLQYGTADSLVTISRSVLASDWSILLILSSHWSIVTGWWVTTTGCLTTGTFPTTSTLRRYC